MSVWHPNNLHLPEKTYLSEAEIRAIEYNEFKEGKSPWELMQNAGKRVAEVVLKQMKRKILILAGPGNNGGDALVCGGYLKDDIDCTVVLFKSPKTEEAMNALSYLRSANPIAKIIETPSKDEIFELMEFSDLIIDGIFGIGITSEIKEPYRDILNKFEDYSMGASNTMIVSIDVPSGMNCTTGEWHCKPYVPSIIVSMQFSKKCFKEFKKSDIIVADIGFSDEFIYYVGPGQYKYMWPKREPDSYKGKNGRLIVIGGSDMFTGAPVLSGMASLRTGIDSLRIAVPETIRDIVAGYAEDFIVLKVKGDKITSKGFEKYKDLVISRHDVAAVGMGLSNHPECIKFVIDWFKYSKGKIKVVLDADAIRAFKGELKTIKDSGAIVTPHKAELRTLVSEHVPDEPMELVQFTMNKAKELGIVILLKGRIDIITDGKRILLNKTGHPGMTVGGTGDVLAGLVGAVNCFVEDTFYATAIAAYIMGLAGEYAGKKYGNSLLASDVVMEIPKVILDLDKITSRTS